MVSLQKDTPKDGSVLSLNANRFPLPAPHQAAPRSSPKLCPACGSITVRARDGRDMCVVCGYLQTHA